MDLVAPLLMQGILNKIEQEE
ncbi:hypothetical protein NTG1052_290031 [Candidatus Nitrotoga sp. 1052]|nr:hypothetical protein NTG1052_290031 [Candidatus Nitrotoga sp. 1052]